MKQTKYISTIAILLCYSLGLFGQQETIMTKYVFNSLFFNPAYAGSHGEGIGTATVQYRNQWLGVVGAPTTMLASGEVSLYDNSLGIGATLGRETIGANARNEYRLPHKDWKRRLLVRRAESFTFQHQQ